MFLKKTISEYKKESEKILLASSIAQTKNEYKSF